MSYINRSSAEQRKGRAGRTQPGVCHRMYSQKNFLEDMEESQKPEILCSSLQKAALKLLEFNLDPLKFDFVDSPPEDSLRSALYSLEHLGAFKDGVLTASGREMAKLPLEPQWSKLVLRGIDEGIGYECMVIAALATLSGRVQFRTEENKHEADNKMKRFYDEQGDFHTFMHIFFDWKGHGDAKNRWCNVNCINAKSMRTANNVVEEICDIVRKELRGKKFEAGLREPSELFQSKFKPLLLECLSENFVIFSGHERAGYFSPYLDDNYFIHPSSALCHLSSRSPMFLIYGTILKTSRSFLLSVTPVEESAINSAYQSGKFEFQLDVLKRFQVIPKVMRPIGESILVRYIIGKDGCNIKNIEKQIEAQIKVNAFHIEVNIQKGEIVLHMEQQYFKTAESVLSKAIAVGQEALSKEEMLCSGESGPFKFLVGCGGIVGDIILPGESREIKVESKEERRLDTYKVLRMLDEYGPYSVEGEVSHEELLKRRFTDSISVSYEKLDHAKRALCDLENSQQYLCTAKVRLSEIMNREKPLFKVKFSWRRMACNGEGYIDFFDASDCVQASYWLKLHPFYIGSKAIDVEPTSKNGTMLCMKKLPMSAEEANILEILKCHMPSRWRVQSVMVMRDLGTKASSIDIALAKKKIQSLFEPYINLDGIVIEMDKIESGDEFWHGVIYFSDFDAGEKAMEELKGNSRIGEFEVDLQAVFSCNLRCRKRIYSVCEKEFTQQFSKMKKKKICTEHKITFEHRADYVNITFKSKNINDLTQVRSEISKIMNGVHINCSGDKKWLPLFSKAEEISYNMIERVTKTAIYISKIRKIISIYGSPKACDKAREEIMCMSENSMLLKTKVYDLRDNKIPHGFVKVIYKNFGSDLLKMIKTFELKNAYFNIPKRQLIVQGAPKKIAGVERHLESICEELGQNLPRTAKAREEQEEIEMCPVCFDEIGKDVMRLENCGHAMCKPCLQLYLQTDVIPIVCVQKDCERKIVIEDLHKIFVGRDCNLRTQFCKRALETYVKENPDKIRYCLTPDCPMLYRNNSRSGKFKCPCCENLICTRCHTFYHHGMTCEMFQNTKVDEDYSVKVWMAQEEGNRKMCPKCKMGLEKDGGCNHILCTNCNSHLCWLCLRCFEDNDAVYEHLPHCPLNNVC